MNVISIANLRKHFGAAYVLKGIDLSFDNAQVIGYIGPNGAGKSTTIKILTGIIPDFEGEVNILGMDIKKQALEIKQKVGYIPEQAAIYEVLTPLEYLTFIGRLHRLEQPMIDKKSGELLRLTRGENGDVVRMHWATYRFTRRQETFDGINPGVG